MKKCHQLIVFMCSVLCALVCFSHGTALSQEPADSVTIETTTYRITKYYQVGASTGTLRLFGDLPYDINPSLAQRLGGELYFNYGITPSMTLGVALITGSLFGEIRSDSSSEVFSNINVKTPVVAPQIRLGYHFGGHFRKGLPGTIQPWVYAGVQWLFFKPLADMVNSDGIPYHYWSDGTIRDQPENIENIGTAAFLNRNYIYDTDLRSANLDGFGNYPRNALAFPVGAGIDLNVSNLLTISFGTSWHYTLTNHLDNITEKSGENNPARAIGNKNNDSFLMFHLGLSFKHIEADKSTTRSIIVLPTPRLPEDFKPFDVNEDGVIQREEVLRAINEFFNGESPHSAEMIQLLVDFFNVQQPKDQRIIY